MENREIFHQALAMMTVGLNEFTVAIDDGGMIPDFDDENNTRIDTDGFSLTFVHYTWIFYSDKFISRIIGALMAAILLEKVGRKPLLAICATTFCLSWLILMFTQSVFILFLARIAFGIASGINEVTNAIYLGENSSPSTRSIFGIIIKCIYSLGFLVGYIIGWSVHSKAVAQMNFFITLLSLVSIFWMVEPVQYLLMKGKTDQAEKNFIWLKGVTNLDQVTDEFEKIKQNVNAEVSKKSSFTQIFTYPANYKSLLIMLTISSLVGFINYDVLSLVEILFLESTYNSTWYSIVILFVVTQCLVLALSLFIIRRFNRRSTMMISSSLISIALFLIAVILFIGDTTKGWPKKLLVISTLFFNSVYAFTFANTFLLRSELFPLSMKAIGGSVSMIGYILSGFLMTEIIRFLIRHNHLISIFLSGIGVILVLFLHYVKWPETENKSLVEIQEKLEKENWNREL